MNRSRSRVTHRLLALAFASGLATVVAVSGAGLASAATADDPATNQNTFALSAEGDGMTYEVIDGSLPAVTDVVVSPYSSQASVDSNADSTALAGAPYLGPVLETIGGTVNGLSGGATPPIPPLPGYVQSSYPQQKTATEAQGPYLLLVNSGAYESDATAGVGVSPNAASSNQQVFSTAKVIANPDGSVVSTASAGVDGLNVGPIDALNVSTNLSITEDGKGGTPKVAQQQNFGTFTILGFNIGITQAGFTVLGANLPLPTADILKAVNQALGSAGLQLSVLPTTTGTSNGTGATTVTSGGLQITEVANVPTQGPTTVQYTYGRATVGAADVANPFADDGSGDDSSTTTPVTAPSSTDPTTDTPSSAPTASASSAAPVATTGTTVAPVTSSSDASVPVTSGALPPPTDTSGSTVAAAIPPVVATAPDSSTASTPTTASAPVPTLGYINRSAAVLGTNSRLLYLVLVLGGLAAFIGQSLFRNLGVRLKLQA